MKGWQGRFLIVSKRPALGKGMGALIGGDYSSEAESVQGPVAEVPVDKIKTNPDQPRKVFDRESLDELKVSIQERGVLQPILVTKAGDDYQIVAGERRFRAARAAGLEKVPVIIRDFSETEKLEIAIIENIQREDLNPVEEAAAYRELMEKSGLNQEEVAAKVGKNRSTVANSLRLLKLPGPAIRSLETGGISAGHARAILSLDTEQQMLELHRRILEEGLSVREAEAWTSDKPSAGKTKSRTSGKEQTRDPQLKAIQEKFIDKLGTKVDITGSLENGKVEIRYYSMDDLDRLYNIISK